MNVPLALPIHHSVLREETDRFLATLETQATKTIVCNSTSAIVQLIDQGHAIGFLPMHVVDELKTSENLTILGPVKGYWNHHISIIIRNYGAKIAYSKVVRRTKFVREDL